MCLLYLNRGVCKRGISSQTVLWNTCRGVMTPDDVDLHLLCRTAHSRCIVKASRSPLINETKLTSGESMTSVVFRGVIQLIRSSAVSVADNRTDNHPVRDLSDTWRLSGPHDEGLQWPKMSLTCRSGPARSGPDTASHQSSGQSWGRGGDGQDAWQVVGGGGGGGEIGHRISVCSSIIRVDRTRFCFTWQ